MLSDSYRNFRIRDVLDRSLVKFEGQWIQTQSSGRTSR